MAMVRVEWFLLMLMVTLSARVGFAESGQVAWQTDVETAWTAARKQGRPLLVFVTRDRCAYCTQMKDFTYGNPTVAGAINRSFVPLVLDAGAPSPLLKELRVSVYPSTIVISPQAVIIARIDGYVPPETLAGRLNTLRPTLGVAKATAGP